MPICDRKIVESFADLGIPPFACSPNNFHDLMLRLFLAGIWDLEVVPTQEL
ncbi:MAG: hypothetical protein HRU34_21750 [Richelia sp.]|nr:hypothetical protein [Richelia sp.]CDN11207.1 hypothetical protein RintRC_3851 [Richelia intracellularis]